MQQATLKRAKKTLKKYWPFFSPAKKKIQLKSPRLEDDFFAGERFADVAAEESLV